MTRFIVKINAEFALFTWSCLSAVFYNKSKVTNIKEAQQGNYRAYGAKSGVDGYPWDYDYWSTCGGRNIEEKTDENFPRRSCNWGKVSSLGQLLGRRRSTQVVDSRKNSELEQNIWPTKNIVCNHTAKKKYCLQSYGQQQNIALKRILSANQNASILLTLGRFLKYQGQLPLCLWHTLYLSIMLYHHTI